MQSIKSQNLSLYLLILYFILLLILYKLQHSKLNHPLLFFSEVWKSHGPERVEMEKSMGETKLFTMCPILPHLAPSRAPHTCRWRI